MTLLEDARMLNTVQPLFEEGNDLACRLCGELIRPYPDLDGHEPGCPWLAMPRIVAALEAAERVISTYDHPDNCDGTVPINGPEYQALVAAMRGDQSTSSHDNPFGLDPDIWRDKVPR